MKLTPDVLKLFGDSLSLAVVIFVVVFVVLLLNTNVWVAVKIDNMEVYFFLPKNDQLPPSYFLKVNICGCHNILFSGPTKRLNLGSQTLGMHVARVSM